MSNTTIRLHRPGWTNHNWCPHGTAIPVRFDADDNAEVDADVFDEWIGDDKARVMGITVSRHNPDPQVEVEGCPTCGATGDDPCVKASGRTARKAHKNR